MFTLRLAEVGAATLVERVDALRAAYAATAEAMPFATRAVVVLPDHLHAVWTLPEGDVAFARRWSRVKRLFAEAVEPGGWGGAVPRTWQKRFWERGLRGEDEVAACLQDVWHDPVRHGLVERAVDWPYSSVHRDIAAGRVRAVSDGDRSGGFHPPYEDA